jgi:hypothetical protein
MHLVTVVVMIFGRWTWPAACTRNVRIHLGSRPREVVARDPRVAVGRRQAGMAGQHANGCQRHVGPNPQHDRGSPQIMEPQPRPAKLVDQLTPPHLRTEVRVIQPTAQRPQQHCLGRPPTADHPGHGPRHDPAGVVKHQLIHDRQPSPETGQPSGHRAVRTLPYSFRQPRSARLAARVLASLPAAPRCSAPARRPSLCDLGSVTQPRSPVSAQSPAPVRRGLAQPSRTSLDR